MFKLTGSLLAVSLYIVSFPAMAANFAGLSFGKADVDISGYDTSSTSKFFAGHRAGTFGFEAAYINMGNFIATGSADYVHVEGAELSGMAFHDVGSVTFFGKAGLFAWDTQASTTSLTIPTDNGIDITYGIGVLYKFAAIPFSVRAEYQIFKDVSTTDIDMWTIGAHFWF